VSAWIPLIKTEWSTAKPSKKTVDQARSRNAIVLYVYHAVVLPGVHNSGQIRQKEHNKNGCTNDPFEGKRNSARASERTWEVELLRCSGFWDLFHIAIGVLLLSRLDALQFRLGHVLQIFNVRKLRTLGKLSNKETTSTT
jgi:hypothetical protein